MFTLRRLTGNGTKKIPGRQVPLRADHIFNCYFVWYLPPPKNRHQRFARRPGVSSSRRLPPLCVQCSRPTYPAPAVAAAFSSLFLSSLSFCSTSSSMRSTLYWRASRRWRTALARSRASPSSGVPSCGSAPLAAVLVLLLGDLAAAGFLFPAVAVALFLVTSPPPVDIDSRPCWSSARALSVSRRRSRRSSCRSARSSSCDIAGASSSRKLASAAARRDEGTSS